MNALHRIALHRLLYVCLTASVGDSFSLFTSTRGKGEKREREREGWGRLPVRSRMRMDFFLWAIFLFWCLLWQCICIKCLVALTCPPPLTLLHASPYFSMTSSNGGHRYGLRIALKLAQKKKTKEKKCALTFSVCGCHWPSTVYGRWKQLSRR